MEYNYKFCIFGAGRGTRNKSIEGLHKALLPLENKPVISHILDKVPNEVEIVLAIGYKGDQIKSYVQNVHPDRKITFVEVDNFDGPGSGPGYSLLCCAPYLNCPFIFMPVDTITEENYNYHEVKNNWVGVSNIDERYASIYCLVDGENYLNKFYWGTGDKAFVGIAGIYDHEKFWKDLSEKSLINKEHQVFNGFTNIKDIELKYFKWYDTGNIDSYAKTKNRFSHEVVAPKINEALFIERDKVIKFFSDPKKVTQRIKRTEFLNGTCPKVTQVNDNMYSYDFIPGKTLAKINDVNVLSGALDFWKYMLRKGSQQDPDFRENCKAMYHDKIYERCKYFADQDIDKIQYINGARVERIYDMLAKVDWEKIYDSAIPSRFHGDFQPENIVYDGKDYFLIDWRESFGKSIDVGDAYYDLSKLYHALLINGSDVNNRMYRIEINDNEAFVFNHSRSNLIFLMQELEKFCQKYQYSWTNVSLLGTLHYLSICSLYNDFHNGDYGKFLFLYGKYLLTNFIK